MSNLVQRVTKRIKNTANAFRSDCEFSLKLAFLRVGDELGGRIHLNALSEKAHAKKDAWIIRYLSNELHAVLHKFENDIDIGQPQSSAPVWVCWWSGESSAPVLVRQCIKSIRKNAGRHPVYLITKENYSNYLTIPAFILDKVRSGQMCKAHLADYVRVKLLAEHGGLWLDATIFCADVVPETYFEIPVFTCKSEPRKCNYISEYRWTTFCLGGWKGNVFYRFLTEAFEQYWMENKYAIDYLLFDYIICVAYQTNSVIKKLLDEVPINNPHRDDLQAAMNAVLPAIQFEQIIQPDTTLYKLSWREVYSEKTSNENESIYGLFLHA